MKFIDLNRQYQFYQKKIDQSIREVLDEANFIMGRQVQELENKLAAFVGAKHGISCASGTDALLLPLMAYGIQPGDEIITTPFTFIATSEVIALLKAKPVFVDIRDDTYNINESFIEKAITSRTKGIIAVDLFGQCAEYDAINALARKHKLFVIEDAAQSFGAEHKGKKAGHLAEVACTSFFPAKPLGAFGDGGMVFTDHDELASIMKSIRVHGMGTDKYNTVRIGLNARLDTLQAAILLAKFEHFPEEINKRQAAAAYYDQGLKNPVITPKILGHNRSVYAQYSIRHSQRDQLKTHIEKDGIPTAIHYAKPLHLQKGLAYLGYKSGAFPVAENVSREILALPMHPFLTKEEQNHIINVIQRFQSH